MRGTIIHSPNTPSWRGDQLKKAQGQLYLLPYNLRLEVVVSWVIVPFSLVDGNQRFGGRAASIFRVEVRDHGDVSTALLAIQGGF
jgi:hypothetical protein